MPDEDVEDLYPYEQEIAAYGRDFWDLVKISLGDVVHISKETGAIFLKHGYITSKSGSEIEPEILITAPHLIKLTDRAVEYLHKIRTGDFRKFKIDTSLAGAFAPMLLRIRLGIHSANMPWVRELESMGVLERTPKLDITTHGQNLLVHYLTRTDLHKIFEPNNRYISRSEQEQLITAIPKREWSWLLTQIDPKIREKALSFLRKK